MQIIGANDEEIDFVKLYVSLVPITVFTILLLSSTISSEENDQD